ncbi:hypothetical protein [Halobacillus halophilus]|uniref:hypothetical protein n=1 Tax=Halobacillus halophilus TaxID=1570 RepID=UPI001CD69233|nr:hypothetical protein [Halobacillus halophilus]MCA1011390.1 hypothetical protein [Halobacillus halophilus]
MNLNKRVMKLEKQMEEANKETQEQMVCAYLKSLTAPECSNEDRERKYQKVKEYVPHVHHVAI